jgi:hypothetical protein
MWHATTTGSLDDSNAMLSEHLAMNMSQSGSWRRSAAVIAKLTLIASNGSRREIVSLSHRFKLR